MAAFDAVPRFAAGALAGPDTGAGAAPRRTSCPVCADNWASSALTAFCAARLGALMSGMRCALARDAMRSAATTSVAAFAARDRNGERLTVRLPRALRPRPWQERAALLARRTPRLRNPRPAAASWQPAASSRRWEAAPA